MDKQGKNPAIKTKHEKMGLKDSEVRNRNLFETMQECILFLDAASGKVIDINPPLVKLLGYSQGEILGKNISEICYTRDKETFQNAFRFLQKNKYFRCNALSLKTKDGHPTDVEIICNVYSIGQQRVVQCEIRAIDKKKQSKTLKDAIYQIALGINRNKAEKRLRRREQEYQSLVENSPDAISRFDPEGRFLYVNPAQATLLGLPPGDIVGKNYQDIFGMHGIKEGIDIDQPLKRIFTDPGEHTIEYQAMTPQGLRWLQSREVPEFAQDGSIVSVLVVTRDITANKQVEEQLRYLTNHDPMTGLYNRTFFDEELKRLDRGREFPDSVIMADIDDLKETNDSFGHAAGDDLLRRSAQVLGSAFRTEDVVARIGGDEFAVLLPNTSAKVIKTVMFRIKSILDEHNAAFDGNPLQLSFGVSTAEKRGSLTEVLKEADKKMYAEKQAHDASRKDPGKNTDR
jgi:diguanylate cyclase (GGDEF)-like protein/PAS domain S-box-containing protein